MARRVGGGPVAEFCAAMRQLQQQSKLDRPTLARRLGYSRSQLYEILDGRISRPPEWDRLVEPLVRACTGNDEQAVATWRRRHDVLVEVHQALKQLLRQPNTRTGAPKVTPACPYRGLSAFREQDAALFFGRTELTTGLVDLLEHKPLVALVGPSGSGKSSLAFAGAVPRLREAGWVVTELRPAVGSTPLGALAAVLLPLLEPDMTEAQRLLEASRLEQALGQRGLTDTADRVLKRQQAQRLLLVVDQFEELFARDPLVARQFLDLLLQPVAVRQAGGSPALTVLLTLRADFLNQVLKHADLAAALPDSTLVIGRMTHTQLGEVIEGPLPRDVCYEPGLVERIITDAGDEAGNLALLEFALTVLWEHQHDHTLSHAGYEELGGVTGALARYAEAVYHNDPELSKLDISRLFIQLVRLGEKTEPTRRVARRRELDKSLWPIAQRLAATRLIVTGRDETGQETVELAHEALISGWDRLRHWITSDRDFRGWQERLRTAVEHWEASGRDHGALLRGVPLAEAQRWLNERPADISPFERSYVAASRAQQGRTVRRLRVFTGGLAVLVLVAGGLGISAERQRQQITYQEREAISRALAAQADATMHDRPVTSILLSLQAFNEADTAEARGALLHHFVEHLPTTRLLAGHTEQVSGMAFSADGKTLATTGVDRTVRLWDLVGGRRLATLSGHADRVTGVAFSPGGELLATSGDDRTVRLWDTTTHRELAVLTGHADRVREVAFSPDGRLLVTTGDGHRLASTAIDATLRLWDVATRRELAVLTGHAGWVRAVAFSPDGRVLATSGVDRTVRLWDVATRRELATLTGHTGSVGCLAFSPDGATLASGSADRTIRLWDMGSRRELAVLTGHTDGVTGIAFSPDGGTLATGSPDQTVRLWDVAARRLMATHTGHAEWSTGVAFSPDGQTFATASQDHSVRIWEIPRRPRLTTRTGRPQEVYRMVFSPDHHTLVTAGPEGTVRTWDVATLREVGTPLVGQADDATEVAFSPDGRLLATGNAKGAVRLWDTGNHKELAALAGHTDRVRAVAFSPDGRTLATVSYDRTVRLWDVVSRRELVTLTGHDDWVSAVAFSPDGRTLATGSADRTVRLWDVAARRELTVVPIPGAWASAIAFSPDGHTLAVGSQDATIRLWDVTSRRMTATLTGHNGWIWSVAFSPEGDTLSSAGDDGTVRLWDVATRRELTALSGHSIDIPALALSPDGHLLAAVGEDTTLRLWDLNPASWRRHLCNLAGRNLTRQEWDEFLPGRRYQRTCPEKP